MWYLGWVLKTVQDDVSMERAAMGGAVEEGGEAVPSRLVAWGWFATGVGG